MEKSFAEIKLFQVKPDKTEQFEAMAARMAAEQLKRRAFIMELDEKFCDVIIHRWEEFTGEKAIKLT